MKTDYQVKTAAETLGWEFDGDAILNYGKRTGVVLNELTALVNECNKFPKNEYHVESYDVGISLRDEIAMKVLNGLICNHEYRHDTTLYLEYAAEAYIYADTMLKARAL